MKLPATNRLQLTEDINIGLIFNASYTTFDLVNHHGSAENLIGKYTFAHLQVFTKWVPRLTKFTKQLIEKNIDISLKKVNVDNLYLLTFHGGEYQNNRYCLPQIARFISGNW